MCSPGIRTATEEADKINTERIHQFTIDHRGGFYTGKLCTVGVHPRTSKHGQASGHGRRIFLEFTGGKSSVLVPAHLQWRRQGTGRPIGIEERRWIIMSANRQSGRFGRLSSIIALSLVIYQQVWYWSGVQGPEKPLHPKCKNATERCLYKHSRKRKEQ